MVAAIDLQIRHQRSASDASRRAWVRGGGPSRRSAAIAERVERARCRAAEERARRRADIIQRIADGWTLAAIGELYNLSRQRIHAIAKSPEPRPTHPAPSQIESLRILAEHGSISTQAFAESIGISEHAALSRLDALKRWGWAESSPTRSPSGPGRPPLQWSITEAGGARLV